MAAFGGIGALLAARVVGSAIGWLLFAAGGLSASMFLASEAAIAAGDRGGDLNPILVWYTTWSWMPTIVLMVTALVLFPTGLPRSRWRSSSPPFRRHRLAGSRPGCWRGSPGRS